MKPQIYIISIAVLMLALASYNGATTTEQPWQIIKVQNKFAFQLPPELMQKEVMGIDSLVGTFEGKGMTVSYDYGWYSDPLENYSSNPRYMESKSVIDGKPAKMVFYQDDTGMNYAAITFRDVERNSSSPTHLTMYASYSDAVDKVSVLKVFNSIDFL